MNVLLINPFIYDFAAFDYWAKPRGLLEVGRLLMELGYTVDFLDCLYPRDPGMAAWAQAHPTIEPPRAKRFGTGSYFREEVAKPEIFSAFPRRWFRHGFHPDYLRHRLQSIKDKPVFIGVTGIMTYWHTGVRETIAMASEVFPETPVVLGGIYPTLLPDHAQMAGGASHVFTGQATRDTLPRWLDQHQLPRPERDLDGQSGNGAFYPYNQPGYGITSLSTGCHQRCSYCASWWLHPQWQPRNYDQALAEVGLVYRQGCRDIAFYDDDLLFDSDHRLWPFLERVRGLLPGLRWHTPNGLYLNQINPHAARALKHYGFETLRFGFETDDPELSQRIGHKINRDDFAGKIRDLFTAGFRPEQIGIYVMMGLPGQNPEHVAQSIQFVRQCGVGGHLTEFSPVPGTPEYERARAGSLVDFAREPLYQNNSLLALRSREFTLDRINALKNQCHP